MDTLIYLSLALNVTAFVLWAWQSLELSDHEDQIKTLRSDVNSGVSRRELSQTTDHIFSRIWLTEQDIKELRKQDQTDRLASLRPDFHQIALDAGVALAQVNKLAPAVDQLATEVRYLKTSLTPTTGS